MTAKSIIEIDVQDQAFKDFQALFEKYRSQLPKVKKESEDIGAAWGKFKTSINPFAKMQKGMKDFSEMSKKAGTTQDKLRVAAMGSAKLFGSMATNTGKLAKNIGGITTNLLRWAGLTSVFTGLLGAGGLFGLRSLAESAGNSRRESQGLGISAGEHEAAKINYQKFVDVDSILRKINEAKYDVTKRSSFAAAGMNPGDWEKQNSAQILTKLIPQIKAKAARGDGSEQYATASGLTQFVDMETINRLKAMTNEEIAAATASYESDRRKLSISDETQRSWQTFNMQLNRSGAEIQNSFTSGLVKLTGPLTNLSAAFSKAVQTFMSSPRIGQWIDSIGEALKKFASYLTSDDFEKDIKSFFEGVQEIISALGKLAKFINKVAGWFGGSDSKPSAEEQRFLDSVAITRKQEEAGRAKRAAEEKKASADTVKKVDAALKAAPANVVPATKTDKSQSPITPAEAAKRSQEKYGIPAEVTLAQFKLESANGTRMPAGSNNPFGIKARQGQPFVEAQTTEVINGVSQKVTAKFAKFDSLADAFDAHAKLLATAPAYANARKNKDDPKAFADSLTGVYATDPKYGEKLKSIIAGLGARPAGTQVATAAPASQQPAQQAGPGSRVAQTAQISVSITKAAGADVFTSVNGLGYAG